MRPTLTVASSLTPHLPWWRNAAMTSAMVGPTITRVIGEVAKSAGENEPVTGVAVVIRVPGAPRAVDVYPGWSWPMEVPAVTRAAEVVTFCRPSEAPHADV